MTFGSEPAFLRDRALAACACTGLLLMLGSGQWAPQKRRILRPGASWPTERAMSPTRSDEAERYDGFANQEVAGAVLESYPVRLRIAPSCRGHVPRFWEVRAV